MYQHKTKEGRLIPVKDLTDDHLNNIIKLIKKKAKKGLTIMSGGGHDVEDIWYDEETIFGKDVKEHFNYKEYKKELKRRLKNE